MSLSGGSAQEAEFAKFVFFRKRPFELNAVSDPSEPTCHDADETFCGCSMYRSEESGPLLPWAGKSDPPPRGVIVGRSWIVQQSYGEVFTAWRT